MPGGMPDVFFCLQVVWLITSSGVGGLLNGSLWYMLSRHGIKQLGSSFGFIFPSSPMKVA